MWDRRGDFIVLKALVATRCFLCFSGKRLRLFDANEDVMTWARANLDVFVVMEVVPGWFATVERVCKLEK